MLLNTNEQGLRGMPRRRLTKPQVLKALKAKSGNVAAAARDLDVSRTTIYNKIKRHPDLLEVLHEARAELVDIAEDALRRAAMDGERWAVMHILNGTREGRARGHGKHATITHQGGEEPIKYIEVPVSSTETVSNE